MLQNSKQVIQDQYQKQFGEKRVPKEKTDGKTLKTINVMVRKVITVDEKASVKEAADLMNHFEIGSIITTRKGKPVGIITERDLLERIVSEGKNPKKVKVKEIMSSPLLVITPDTDLEEAARIMFERNIKKLPVTEQNRLVGMLSLTDIARVQSMENFLHKLSETQTMPNRLQNALNNYVV